MAQMKCPVCGTKGGYGTALTVGIQDVLTPNVKERWIKDYLHQVIIVNQVVGYVKVKKLKGLIKWQVL